MKLSDPLLRLYVMHAGWPMIDRMLGLLYTFPQVYAELGWLHYQPPKEYQAYIRRLVEAGDGKRLMFGSDSDPEEWPGNALAAFEQLDFLLEQERDSNWRAIGALSRVLGIHPSDCFQWGLANSGSKSSISQTSD